VKHFSVPGGKAMLPKAKRDAIADIVKCRKSLDAGEHTIA
jgi:hypothetical protein